MKVVEELFVLMDAYPSYNFLKMKNPPILHSYILKREWFFNTDSMMYDFNLWHFKNSIYKVLIDYFDIDIAWQLLKDMEFTKDSEELNRIEKRFAYKKYILRESNFLFTTLGIKKR